MVDLKPRKQKKMEDYLEKHPDIMRFYIDFAIKELGISEKAATLRVKALSRSNIRKLFGEPNSDEHRIAVGAALRVPQLGESEE